MPAKNITYIVRKVEHEFGLTLVKPKFPKMADLYLKFLINKSKVNGTLASENMYIIMNHQFQVKNLMVHLNLYHD